jgi:hypothetical protein
MDIEDLLKAHQGTLVFIKKTSTYKGGAEHISFLFEDSITKEKFSISITAERGSDLWTTVRKKK